MMRTMLAIGIIGLYFHVYLPSAFSQAFGEYGRALGGVTKPQGSVSPKGPGGVGLKEKGKGGGQGIGDVGVPPLQTQLVVISNSAPLYPRQDDETQRIEEISQGAILVPMLQGTSGAISWYMVKTQKGTIGWVKSTDVREQAVKSK